MRLKLSDVALVFNGKTPPVAEQRLDGHPVLKIRDVTEDGKFVGEFNAFVDPEFAERFREKWICQEDTLVLNAAHNAEYVASKTYLAEPPVEGCLPTGEWLIVRPDGVNAHKRFVHYWLLSRQTRQRIKDCVKGIHLYPRDVADIPIQLPPMDEQRRIATILDKATDICRKRQILLRNADELVRSEFLQLLNTLPEERLAVEELLPETSNAIRTGPFGSQLLHSEFTDSGIPVLGIDNIVTNRFRWAERRYISEQKYQELRRYRVFPGDVMVTIMGTTGRVCIAPSDLPECISTKHLCTITPDRQRLLSEYLGASLLWDPAVRAQAAREGKGAIMEGWNMGIVRGLLIKIPSIAQQKRFAAFAQKAEQLRVKLQKAELQSNELFDSLAHRAFSGQL